MRYVNGNVDVSIGIDTNSNRNINISVNIPQNTGEEIISISHLRKEFPGVVPISDITASIKSGDVISVIGPSGTGKSTFLRLLNGLETPTSGKIVVFGRDIGDKNTNLNLIRKRMNMVFQSFNLFNNLTVLENVMIGPITLNKMTKQEAYDNAMYLLKTVGVANKALEMPENLSGGQKQRVAIARALAMNPKVILLDEPTSALDPAMTGEVSEVIRYLSDLGMTMIIVTHEMKLAKTVSKRIFYLDQGELYEDGTPEQIFENPKRTRTRLFIKKLKSVAIVVDSPDYDYISAKQTLLEFSVRCKLDEEITENLVKIFNLILKHNEFIPEAVDAHKLHVIAEFDSDNNKASMTFVRECESFNMIDCLGDDRDAVFSMVENVEYSYEDGKNTLKLNNVK